MIGLNNLLHEAQLLPTEDQLRLIDALWEYVPSDEMFPLQADWEAELQGRVASLEGSSTASFSWEEVRDVALKRILRGSYL